MRELPAGSDPSQREGADCFRHPGYLPVSDDPMSAETPEECWSWLADERRRDLDNADSEIWARRADQGEAAMMDHMGRGEYPASWGVERTGTIGAMTPGEFDHDLGLCYTVREVVHACLSAPARTCEACEIIESWED